MLFVSYKSPRVTSSSPIPALLSACYIRSTADYYTCSLCYTLLLQVSLSRLCSILTSTRRVRCAYHCWMRRRTGGPLSPSNRYSIISSSCESCLLHALHIHVFSSRRYCSASKIYSTTQIPKIRPRLRHTLYSCEYGRCEI